MHLKKILVAIDLTREGDLTPPTKFAIEEALYWAKTREASVCFAHFVDVSETLWQRSRSEPESSVGMFYSGAQTTLKQLVADFEEKGIDASCLLERGRGWMELVRTVQKNSFDVVFAGTAAETSLSRALFGGTTHKLVRKCPAPVWVVKEALAAGEGCVLAPHDLEETGESILRWSAAIATQLKAPLNILHALHLPEFNRFMDAVPSSRLAQEKQQARETIERQLEKTGFSGNHRVILEIGPPAPAIHSFLSREKVRLLVMGSVARSGIPGLLVGNTAETILPWARCSVLVLKPEGFVSPVV